MWFQARILDSGNSEFYRFHILEKWPDGEIKSFFEFDLSADSWMAEVQTRGFQSWSDFVLIFWWSQRNNDIWFQLVWSGLNQVRILSDLISNPKIKSLDSQKTKFLCWWYNPTFKFKINPTCEAFPIRHIKMLTSQIQIHIPFHHQTHFSKIWCR